ncbi:hypothetical protein TcG_07391 [Trypanosoma cruzi]|nr:hypothetical protein TcG_07391 [Trypanosoma cruzi]
MAAAFVTLVTRHCIGHGNGCICNCGSISLEKGLCCELVWWETVIVSLQIGVLAPSIVAAEQCDASWNHGCLNRWCVARASLKKDRNLNGEQRKGVDGGVLVYT